MSVLIKGMKMPKNCGCCPMCYCDHYGYVMCALISEEVNLKTQSPDCLLVEVKEPHGRLGDLDELKTAFPKCDNSMDIKIASVRATINHAQTIIEAEGSET